MGWTEPRYIQKYLLRYKNNVVDQVNQKVKNKKLTLKIFPKIIFLADFLYPY